MPAAVAAACCVVTHHVQDIQTLNQLPLLTDAGLDAKRDS